MVFLCATMDVNAECAGAHVELADETSLGDAQRLLLHDLVYCGSVVLRGRHSIDRRHEISNIIVICLNASVADDLEECNEDAMRQATCI